MSLASRIRERRESLGISQIQLAEMIGVTKGAIGNVESGTSGIKAGTLYKICKVLKCDPNYLYQDEVHIESKEMLSPDELFHLKKYRTLDERGKDHVDKVLEWETQRIKEISSLKQQVSESASNVDDITTIPLRLSNQGAAAGHGTYLGPEDFSIITVLKNNLTKAANFAVPVSGDSMEPKFHDGDILLVGDEIPEVDDIGIFTMDGKGYVKKMGENELVSLNPAYDPIPMEDSIINNGKVIGVLEPEMIVK